MSKTKRRAFLVATQIKDIFGATAVAAANQERRELASFCLLLAKLEEEGRLEEAISLMRPMLDELLSQTEAPSAVGNHSQRVKWH